MSRVRSVAILRWIVCFLVCVGPPASEGQNAAGAREKVIIDTDIGR
jgi:hypothetical protein